VNRSIQPEKLIEPLRVPSGKPVNLRRDHDPAYTDDLIDKKDAAGLMDQGVARLSEAQEMLYAQNIHALLVVIQGMDACGKDGTIKHVMSGVNPQGCQVFSFKVPSAEEYDHDYLWRFHRALPERGRIGIFNRSYYEDVLVVRVHPEILARAQLPPEEKKAGIWKRRFRQINEFERNLVENGTRVVKLFLNVSKEEQRKRFLKRIDRPEKNWKFSAADVAERAYWDDYQRAYEDMLRHTSTERAPWYVIPADKKWFAHVAVATVLNEAMRQIAPAFPSLSPEHLAELAEARQLLEAETPAPEAAAPPKGPGTRRQPAPLTDAAG
jgi:PPK2 family polyphosphate:nucleotide phosphotransferase